MSTSAYKALDMASYPRRAHFDYFRSLAYPYAGLTADIDVTRLVEYARACGRPFFLSALYACARAANRVPEFRQRISGDGVIEYESCGTSHVTALEDNTFCYCRLDGYSRPYGEFIPYAHEEQARCTQTPSIEDDESSLSLFFVSCVPWVSFTSLIQPAACGDESNPRITFGKYRPCEGRLMMPVSVLAHHALVDGYPIGLFYKYFDEEIARIVNG